MTKKEYRSIVKDKKRKLSEAFISSASECITNKLLNSIEYKENSVIYTYVSFNQEVQTNHIIETALKDHKKIAVPKVIEKVENSNFSIIREMHFYYINSMQDLEQGFYGIKEPSTNEIALNDKVLFIMPGLAFDLDKNRIGYGGGYYDKYLTSHSHVDFRKISLAYDFQIFDQLSVCDYDRKVDKIITEHRIIE